MQIVGEPGGLTGQVDEPILDRRGLRRRAILTSVRTRSRPQFFHRRITANIEIDRAFGLPNRLKRARGLANLLPACPVIAICPFLYHANLVFRIVRSSEAEVDTRRREALEKMLKADPLHHLQLIKIQQHMGTASMTDGTAPRCASSIVRRNLYDNRLLSRSVHEIVLFVCGQIVCRRTSCR
jgi:hypothetical protein